MRHAAHCYGWVETNLGQGILVERVMNKYGSPSLSLENSLKSNNLDLKRLEQMLEEVKRWSLTFGLVISELNVKNLMHRIDDKDHLVIVDGLGGRKPGLVFYLRQHILWMARHKTRKRWPREFNKVRVASEKIIKSMPLKKASEVTRTGQKELFR